MNRRGRPPHPDILTPREWEVLEFLRQSLSNEQIAEHLGITLRTAKFHVSEILSKLAVESREEAAAGRPEESPTPARRWLAWPLIARIAGAMVVASAVTRLGLLAWGVVRTSGGESTSATDVFRRAIQLVDKSGSYRTEMEVDRDGQPDYVEEFAPPNNYHLWMRTDYASASAVNPWREYIYSGSRYYTRMCDAFPECGGWIEVRPGPLGTEISATSRGWSSLALELGSHFFLPQFGLEAMRLAADPQFRVDTGTDTHLTATTEIERALLASAINVLESLEQYQPGENPRWEAELLESTHSERYGRLAIT